MSWMFLIAAVLLDVAATVLLKYSDGMTRVGVSVLAFALFGISIAAVGLALRELPLMSVYLVWLSLSLALVAGIGGVYFRESLGPAEWTSIAAIVLGVAGLALGGAEHASSGLEQDRRSEASQPRVLAGVVDARPEPNDVTTAAKPGPP